MAAMLPERTGSGGNVVVVTGGSRGIGAATAVRLAADGWSVCVNYHHDGSAADEVVRRCESLGVGAVAVRGDVASADDVAAVFRAADEMGVLGALVNNAGIAGMSARVDAVDPASLARLLQVNVIGTFLCAGEAVRRMSTARGGHGGAIVNVSSIVARTSRHGDHVPYAASKGAVDTMTRGLADEVATEGVRVNAVRPGIIATEIYASGGHPDRAAQLASRIPVRRVGAPKEVAEAVVWLCSPAASYVTGAILDVAGGR